MCFELPEVLLFCLVLQLNLAVSWCLGLMEGSEKAGFSDQRRLIRLWVVVVFAPSVSKQRLRKSVPLDRKLERLHLLTLLNFIFTFSVFSRGFK